MIEKIPDQIPVQTGEWRGTTFDIIPKETFAMACRKINEIIDAVNAIQKEREAERFEIQEWIGILEAVRKSVNIHEKQIDELQMKVEPEKLSQFVNAADLEKQDDPETRSENAHELVTLTDMFNEMGRLYADLWNKLEDIHHYLKTKGCDNE